MGLVATRAEQRASVVNPLHPGDPGLASIFGLGRRTSSGQTVTPDSALTVDAFLSGVRYLCETVASLPLPTYRRLQPRGKERAPDLPLYERLHDQPNRWQTSFEWRDMLMQHVLLRGTSYSLIAPSAEIPPFELTPLHPDRVRPFWAPDGKIAYAYQPPEGPRTILLQEEVMRVTFMPHGLTGISIIDYAQEAIGIALAGEQYAGRTWQDDTTPSGTLNHPGNLSAEARRRLREEWEERHQGRRKIAVLMEGMKFEPVSVTPQDAQVLQSRQLTVRSMARILRVQPHVLMDLSDATFSNVEHEAINTVVYTLRPWLVRIEQAMRRDLLTPAERRQLVIEFLVDGLLRGDIKTRSEALAVQRQWGIINGDEWREVENRNPLPSGQGESYIVPLNMIPLDQLGADAGAASAPVRMEGERRTAVNERTTTNQMRLVRRLRRAYRPAFEDAARRVLRREVNEVDKHFKRLAGARSLADFGDWLEGFYQEHLGIVRDQMLPVVEMFGGAVAEVAADEVGASPPEDLDEFYRAYVAAYAVRHIAQSRARIQRLLTADPDALAGEMDETLRSFTDDRPRMVAGAEVVQASSAIARETWRRVGVTKLRWNAGGERCSLCNQLNGEVVGIEQQFAYVGQTIEGDEDTQPLEVQRKTLHPPLHDGCDCTLEAA